ncbi:BtrH N-terminal domain-containing protein [Antribacter gilvus]|uniref:BtrH N-terminal domain-containing protein n=1 Tax=Antribacter gilvus TaxID=2304675 RepID=UPI000F7A1492|nr:BtrH N-terminal domain-containing protein [Antribacter gilvus]
MTERKAFKARVRAQMAETGRSYAHVAAQLEANNPARPDDTHPASALVVALLRTAGLELRPEVAYGIGGGIGFMYALFSYKEVGHPLLTLVCQHHPAPWAPAILDRLGVRHESATTKREATRLLDAGKPVILPLSRGSIPWLTSTALDANEEHIVIALPHEEEGFRVLDGTGASAVLAREVVMGSYGQARRKHPVLALLDPLLPADVRPALLAGLAATVDGMTRPVLGNSFDVNFGLSGLAKWGRLADDPGRQGWPALFQGTEVWHSRLVACIDREHTAPAAGRPLFARTLRAAGMLDAAETFERSGRQWREIAHRAASRTLTFDALGDRVRTIHDLEKQGIDELAADLGGAGTSP